MNTVNHDTGSTGNTSNTSNTSKTSKTSKTNKTANTSNIALRVDTIRGLPARADRDAVPPAEMTDSDERRMRITFRIAFGILIVVPVLVCLLLYAHGADGNAGRPVQETAGTCACHGT